MMRWMWLLFLLQIECASAADWVVTRSDDPTPDGCQVVDCSLREAVLQSNLNPGPDRVLLAAETYTLNLQGIDNTALLGDLDVTDELRVEGVLPMPGGTDFTLITGFALDDRLFDVITGADLTLQSLALSLGGNINLDGGLVRVTEATLHLDRAFLDQGFARDGGAISARFATVDIVEAAFTGNHADQSGGAVHLFDSLAVVQGTQFIDNQAQVGGGALLMQRLQSLGVAPVLHLTDSLFIDNSALGGGALLLSSEAQLPVLALIEHSGLSNNHAGLGGALYSNGTVDVEVRNSTFWDNRALTPVTNGTQCGGAICMSRSENTLRLMNSLVALNVSGGLGGGLSVSNRAELINTTISSNRAAQGGALFVDTGAVELIHVTAHNNGAGGVDVSVDGNVESLSFLNSVIDGACSAAPGVPIASLGGNIETPGNSCGFGAGQNDLTTQSQYNLLDASLADNGGPTQTHALVHVFSPAIGNALVIPGLNQDQRLMPRDAMPDSGAVEAQAGETDVLFAHGFDAF